MNHAERSVLLTGATGFLGSHVANALRAQRVSLCVASRRPRPSPVMSVSESAKATWWGLDLCAPIRLPDGIDTLINVAGEKTDASRMEQINHLGARRVAEAAAAAGVRRFVQVSSVGVYGAAPDSGLVDESFAHKPRNRYESSKDAGERAVREVCLRSGMEWIVVQPSNVIGSQAGRSYPLLGLMSLLQRRKFAWFGDAEPWVNYVAAQDAAESVVDAALNAAAGQSFIVNTPERLADVVGWIAAGLGIP